MTNKIGLSSEKIISEIVRAVDRLEFPQSLNIQVNTVVKGKMHEHQADIYWEFTDGEITYKTIINTHDWQKTASTADVFRFVAELRDIPGQITGVLFTQPVYQKDIHKLASDAGIVLCELRVPAEGTLLQPIVSNPQINVDAEWAKREKERLGKTDETIQLSGNPKYMFIYDDSGNCIDSVQGIIDTYAEKQLDAADRKQAITHNFTEPVYLQTDDELFPRVKLDSISFDLEYIDPYAIEGEEVVRFILENIFNFFGR